MGTADAIANLDAAIGRACRLALPPPKLTVSNWADANRTLSPEASAEPGRWRTDKAPYQRGIMDAFNSPDVSDVVVMSSAQVGKTEVLNNVLGYFIDQDPCPVMLMLPTLELAESWSRDRLAPMVRDTACLAGRIADPKTRDSNNTILHKSFPGGNLDIVGANSPASMSSRPKRVVLCDEVDRFPASAGGEGDPVALARKRTTTYWNRKVGLFSTPTLKGASRIELAFEQSDQRRFFVPCTGCGHFQTLRWESVKWEKDGEPRLQHLSAYIACEECGKRLTDADKAKMIARGEWRATAEFSGVAGFHVNELYSPWVPLASVVEEFLKAKGSPETLRVWTNTALGELWEDEGEQVEVDQLLSRRQPYSSNPLPAGVALITAAVDVQDDRLEIEVAGWGRGQERWSLEFIVLPGDPSRPDVWARLDEVLTRTWETATGVILRIASACVDSGGHHSNEVYRFCKPRYSRRVYAIRGVAGTGRPIVSRPTVNNKIGCRLFSIGVDTAKELIMARLKITESGPGYWHFPASYGEEYFSQLTSEKRAIRYEKGVRKVVWVKVRTRNEALDCAVYNQAALDLLNVNLDRLARKIEGDEKKAGPEPEPESSNGTDALVERDELETPARKGRRNRRDRFSGSITGGW